MCLLSTSIHLPVIEGLSDALFKFISGDGPLTLIIRYYLIIACSLCLTESLNPVCQGFRFTDHLFEQIQAVVPELRIFNIQSQLANKCFRPV